MKGNKEGPCLHPRGFSPGGLRSATQLCLEAGGVSRTGLGTSGSAHQPRAALNSPSGASERVGSRPWIRNPVRTRRRGGRTRGEDLGGLTFEGPLLSPPPRPGLLGWVGRPQATDRSRCRERDPAEQQQQVVAFRPRRQVPPVGFFFFPDAAVGIKFRGGESSNMRPRPLVLRKERTGVREKGWALGPWVRRRAEVCILASDGRGLGPKGL